MFDTHTETVYQARVEATATLRAADIDTAALDARVLLAHVLHTTQTGLLIRDPEPISASDLVAFRDLVHQRAEGIPVAYLTGEREFMGLTFATAPGVLVPRPDTEPLVEWGLRWLAHHPAANIVDIGTGSGAIAISMVFHAPDAWVGSLLATDVSAEALRIATTNADALITNERRNRIAFLQGSLTVPLVEPVDLVITNLPYLTPVQIEGNPALRHEPNLALDGGTDGLDLVRKVIADLPRVLATDGAAGFEIDPSQAETVKNLLRNTLPNHQVDVVYDLAGDERHIVAY